MVLNSTETRASLVRRLFSDDCLDVLLMDPAADSAIEPRSVDLIYLDPPFNSKFTYNLPFQSEGKDVKAVAAFHDTWNWQEQEAEHLKKLEADSKLDQASGLLARVVRIATDIGQRDLAAYLINMAIRLRPMKKLLKPDGSIYLHCDPTASHYLKMLMDAIFGPDCFRNEVIWHYGLGAFRAKKHYPKKHDTLLYYTMSDHPTFNIQRGSVTDAMDKKYCHRDSEGRYMMSYGKKYYLKGGKPVDTVWDIPSISPTSEERLGYPTQKPVALLERIIKASSNPGDVVLDPFCGCGTTLHAAEQLERSWIGIDISAYAASLVRSRLVTNFNHLSHDSIEMLGVPGTVDAARELAERDKFEFEKWACGFIGAHGLHTRGKQPGDKGPDGGIDGIIDFVRLTKKGTDGSSKAVIQVKGGNVSSDAVGALYGTIQSNDELSAGIMVCFKEQANTVTNWVRRNKPAPIRDESVRGTRDGWPAIQCLTIESMLTSDEWMTMLPGQRASRIHEQAKPTDQTRQLTIGGD